MKQLIIRSALLIMSLSGMMSNARAQHQHWLKRAGEVRVNEPPCTPGFGPRQYYDPYYNVYYYNPYYYNPYYYDPERSFQFYDYARDDYWGRNKQRYRDAEGKKHTYKIKN